MRWQVYREDGGTAIIHAECPNAICALIVARALQNHFKDHPLPRHRYIFLTREKRAVEI